MRAALLRYYFYKGTQMTEWKDIVPSLLDVATKAGQATMPFYRQPNLMDVQIKSDHSPQTSADLAADSVLRSELNKLNTGWPILSEEAEIPDFSIRQTWGTYWLLDPLDGTRGFIRGSGEYTVNIALVHKNRPVIGVIYQPVSNAMFWAADGHGAYTGSLAAPEPMHARALNWDNVVVASGVSLGSGRISRFCASHNLQLKRVNSSLKLAYLASGAADIYPRVGPTCEWDLAAGQSIIEQAGGCLVDFEGQPMQYNRKQNLVNGPFIAIGDKTQLQKVLKIMQGVLE